MAKWVARTAGVAARNGTTTHTITTPSGGSTPVNSLLVLVIAGSITHSASAGWTKQSGSIDSAEIALFTRIASAGEASVDITHNGSNYPVQYEFFEFPPGTDLLNWHSQGRMTASAAWATLNRTTGADFVYAAVCLADTGTSSTYATSWTSATESVDATTPFASSTEGIYFTSAYVEDLGASTWVPASTTTGSGSSAGDYHRVMFAVDTTGATSLPTVVSFPQDDPDWSTTPAGDSSDSIGTSQELVLGFAWALTEDADTIGVRWYCPNTSSDYFEVRPELWTDAGTMVASGEWTSPILGWQDLQFSADYAATTGVLYIAAIRFRTSATVSTVHYSANSGVWSSASGTTHEYDAPPAYVSVGESTSRYRYGAGSPNNDSAAWYGTHVLVASPAAPPAEGSVSGTVSWVGAARGQVTPVSAYHFDEGTGSTTEDASGNGHDLTGTGSPFTASGHTNGGTQIDGTNYFDGNPGPNSSLSDWTVMMWVKRTATGTNTYKAVFSNNDNFYFEFNGTSEGTLLLECYAGAGSWPGTAAGDGATLVPLDTWHHIATTRTAAGVCTLYVDGVSVATGSGNAMNFGSGNWKVGGAPGTTTDYFFLGVIDDLRVFASALDPAEITEFMGTPVPSTAAPPSGSVSGTVSWAGTVTGARDSVGSVSGTVSWAGTANGPHPLTTIAEENALTGADSSEYTISGTGDTSVLGFARPFSVNVGETIEFACHGAGTVLDIYRIGYYGGNGWRQVAALTNTATSQPDPTTISSSNGGVTCSNWSTTASWTVPSDTVSGLFVGVYRNAAENNASWIPFVVTDHDREADIIVKTSDATWALAYNYYGTPASPLTGKSVYGSGGALGDITTRAHAMTYEKPIVTRQGVVQTYWRSCEYPMLAWLERMGYSIKYVSCRDIDQDPSCLDGAKVILSSGHDEYWSDSMRDAFEAQRDAGTHLWFASGNEVFWRIRYDSGSDTAWVFKDTMAGPGGHTAGTALDPVTWTGTWKDTRWGGRKPENTITGTDFRMNGVVEFDPTFAAADSFADHPVWRNTTIAPGGAGTTIQPTGIVGFEADQVVPTRPTHKILASEVINIDGRYADDNGQNYDGNGSLNPWGVVAQRWPSGAVVIGGGTAQWGWGLHGVHDRGTNSPNAGWQQFTYNLLLDLGCVPETPHTGITTSSPVALMEYGGPVGAVSGSFSFAGTVTGTVPQIGSVSGTVSWAGTAEGQRQPVGEASGSVSFAGAAQGLREPVAAATGTVSWSGTTQGLREPVGAAAGTVSWAGTVQGEMPTEPMNTGTASGTVVFSSVLVGLREPHGHASGTVSWVGTAVSTTVSGSHSLTIVGAHWA